MSMQLMYVVVLPVPKAVVPGVYTAEVACTLIKPNSVVFAVTWPGTGQGSLEATIGP